MKKNLLLKKRITQFSISFCLMFLCSNIGWSQVVLTDDFGSTAANPFTGDYSPSGGGSVSTITNGSNTYLNIQSLPSSSIPTPTPVRSGLTRALPVEIAANLTDNTKLITWSINLKSNRLGTNAATSYAENKWFQAVVLCATTNEVIGSVPSATSDGYALVYQKRTASTSFASIRLIKFNKGIGNSSLIADAQELCTATILIESPALTVVPALTLFASLSVKVIYNPDTDTWELQYRENNTPADSDPIVDVPSSTGPFLSAGSFVDNTYTSSPMAVCGFVAGLQTNDSYKYQYDDFKIELSPVLGVAKMDTSKFNAYPNPVTNGKLYISSENNIEKKVAIYSILGQKVLDTKTSNNSEINVSKLAKGAYILTVTEEGRSDSKKLIIQ